MTKAELKQTLIELHEKATPPNWTGTSNIPFYAIIDKPAASLSKHDTPTSPHWRVADVELVLFVRNYLQEIIESL